MVIFTFKSAQKRSAMKRNRTIKNKERKEKNNLAHNIRVSKKACFLLIACLVVIAMAGVPYALGYPPAGFDYLPSTTATLQLQIIVGPGAPWTETITASGPTNITRGTPYNPGNGRMKIDTQIVLMNLAGSSAHIGPITITQSPSNATKGAVQQETAGVDFPADSFFDVFVEIHTNLPFPYTVLHNNAYVQVNSTIYSIPPWGSTYVHIYVTAIPLIDQSGDISGYILSCSHEIPAAAVGGNVVPIDKLALLAPYIGLGSMIVVIAVAAVAAAVTVQRVRRRKEKQ
jgi:hypothetical protein